jgi:hemoglobin-like flavoprotein
MTPEQVRLVQQSFAQVVPIADKAAEIFYSRLFELAPAVKPLFRGDMVEQRRKLVAALAVVVGGLSDLPRVLPAAGALAKRHVGYGAQPEHYLWSARRCCGHWRAGPGRGLRPMSRRHGPRPMRPCPAL